MHGFDEYLGFMHHTWDYIRLSQKDVDAYEKKKEFKNFGCQVIGPLVKAEGQGNEELVNCFLREQLYHRYLYG